MELYVEPKRRGEEPRGLRLPDDWVDDVQHRLESSPFKGLVSRLDPYGHGRYRGAELGVLLDALTLYLDRGGRFAEVTHAAQREIRFAQSQDLSVLFAGD